MTPPRMRSRRESGFTLVELAVAFMIIVLLIGSAALMLTAQNTAREIADTQRTLELAREAIIGFAVRHGRLPCPASDGGNDVSGVATVPTSGQESFCTADTGNCLPGGTPWVPQAHGRCSNPLNGFVPAATLGIGPTDAQGFLIDAWQARVRYAVTQQDMTITNAPALPPLPYWIALDKPYTAADGLRRIALVPAKTPPYPPVENLQVTAAGVPITVPAVVFSTGKNQDVPALWSADENENADGDEFFVSRLPAPGFDDIVLWISPNLLFNRLAAAGAL